MSLIKQSMLWTLVATVLMSASLMAMQAQDSIWPSGEPEPPKALRTENIALVPLTRDHASEFLRAYNDQARVLRQQLGWSWPAHDTTAEQNEELVAYHEQQFNSKQSFTYAIFFTNKDGQRRLVGALYLVPVLAERDQVPDLQAQDYQVELSWWLNVGAQDHPVAQQLLPTTLSWLAEQSAWQHLLLPISDNHQQAIEAVEAMNFDVVARDQDAQQRFYTVNIER